MDFPLQSRLFASADKEIALPESRLLTTHPAKKLARFCQIPVARSAAKEGKTKAAFFSAQEILC
jgi:hypothetical protein